MAIGLGVHSRGVRRVVALAFAFGAVFVLGQSTAGGAQSAGRAGSPLVAGRVTPAPSLPFQLLLPVPPNASVFAGGPHAWDGADDGTRGSVDIGPTSGEHGEMSVHAAAAGRARVYSEGEWSDCWVAIDHAGGWQTRYFHLKNVDPSIDGATVAAGQHIGDAGQPGTETCGDGTPGFRHVHFSLWQNGSEVEIDGVSIGGYTVHATGGPYCGYWTRNRDGAVVADAESRCSAVPRLINNQVLSRSAFGEGSFVTAPSSPEIYRIAGGAPIYVSSWDEFGGPQAVTQIADDVLAALRLFPADGTFLEVAGSVYRVVGGAPVYVSKWDAVGGPQRAIRIDSFAVTHAGENGALDHLRQYPLDGTFVIADGFAYRFAGGAPIYVSSWDAVGGPQIATPIDPAAIVHADEDGVWSHVRRHPADGTFVTAGPHVYRFAGGAPIYVSNWDAVGGPQATTEIDPAAVDHADQGTPWNQVRQYPVGGTFVTVEGGGVWRITGGAAVYVESWKPYGGVQPSTLIDGAAIANAGNASPWNHLRSRPLVIKLGDDELDPGVCRRWC